MAVYEYARHGESTANVRRVVAGHSDVELTALGLRQAHEAGDRAWAGNREYDRIISSPLVRAYITASVIAEKTGYDAGEIELHAGLKEKGAGRFELQPIESFYGMSDDELAAGGAETARMFRDRVVGAARDIYERTQHLDRVLIVAHAGIYKIAQATIGNHAPTYMYKIKSPPNAEIMPYPMEEMVNFDTDNDTRA